MLWSKCAAMLYRVVVRRCISGCWRFSGICVIVYVCVNVLFLGSYSIWDRQHDDEVESAEDAKWTENGRRPQHEFYEVKHKNEIPYLGVNLENKFRRLMENSNYADEIQAQDQRSTVDPNLSDEDHLKQLSARLTIISDNSRLIGCSDMHKITDITYLSSGWTKAVYKGYYEGRPVAIKTVDVGGQDVSSCTEKGEDLTTCYLKAAKKIAKEIMLLEAIDHPNVIKVLGYCIPRAVYTGEAHTSISMVTELGESINIIKLLQMWWEDRLRIAYDISVLMEFLSRTSLGSLVMNDFRRQQFVLVGGAVKLSDVDDMGLYEPRCDISADCSLYFHSANISIETACQNGVCVGFNEKKNIFNAGRNFVTFLLPHGSPPFLGQLVDTVISAYGNVTMTSRELLIEIEKLVTIYKSGRYLKRSNSRDYVTRYKIYPHRDLPGQSDYRCRYSQAGSGCTISAFDQREAEDFCDHDEDCQSFVMTSHRTWTGRKLVHLKSGFGSPAFNVETSIFVRPDDDR